jgi:hypothetical protein
MWLTVPTRLFGEDVCYNVYARVYGEDGDGIARYSGASIRCVEQLCATVCDHAST